MNQNYKNSNARLIIGIVFIALGIIFILDNVYIFDFNIFRTIFHWPVILIILGLVFLSGSKDKFLGGILVGVGALFLLSKYLHYSVGSLIGDFWPVGLIVFGLYILARSRDNRRTIDRINSNFNYEPADFLDEVYILSGGNKFFNSQNFRGGKITSIFGSPEINLTNCRLAPGENVLDIIAVFGGIRIRVPEDWNVVVKVSTLFGGFDDKRYSILTLKIDDNKKLIVKGAVIFGGGAIKN